MLAVKCNLKDAEKTRKELIKKGIYDFSQLPKKEQDYIYFPILKKVKGYAIANTKLEQKNKKTTVHDFLEGKLPKKVVDSIPKAMDIIGDIAIIELPELNNKGYSIIGNAVMQAHRQVKVVCKKSGFHEGEYRTRKLEVIAGEKRKETTYLENGVRLKVNAETCYFSPRLSNERIRIAKLIKPKELVLVMFSGVGPYPLVIARNSKAKEIYAIEINPEAHKYALENVQKNKFKNIHSYQGDVNKVLPQLKRKFDRIIMPLPKDAIDFLTLALKYCKKNGIIHLYDFEREEDIPEAVKKRIKSKFNHVKMLRIVKCGQYSPGKYRICIDLKRI